MPTFQPFCYTYPFFPFAYSPNVPCSILVVFTHYVTFFSCLVCLCLHPASLSCLSSSLSLILFHAVSSNVQHFIHALFYFFPSTLSTLLLVSFLQPTFSNLFHFADRRWLGSPFLCTEIEKILSSEGRSVMSFRHHFLFLNQYCESDL